jgi:site-specific DNA recombinase
VTKPIVRKVRCAVYTRKSSEEGLEQEFNSLDAQREACEAYIASQRAEGWVLVPDRYDDGGVSGGTLERPALKRLLGDIERGLVDVVVVYKIDRLSRSLMDFAKLVDVFDAHEVTFVSVTQSFNTTTSMGRLTLNILLSFAQFEREVIGERIRDKFAASRARGMWMGGWAPLGYDICDRKLVVNESEAALVRRIFERFVRLGSATKLVMELAAEGVSTSEASQSTRASSTSSSTTGSTLAKRCTRARAIPASTPPSLARTSGTRSTASSARVPGSGPPRRGLRPRRC